MRPGALRPGALRPSVVRSFIGTGQVIRLVLRSGRTALTGWVLVLGALPAIVASTLANLYSDEASRAQLTTTITANPGMEALIGPVHGTSIGALSAWRSGTIGAVLIAVMAVLTVISHTRAEEETGRRELLGSTVIGRHAPLAAALIVTSAAGLAIGVLATVGLLANGLPVGGSVAFGLAWCLLAAAFTGIGALTAQLTEGSGAARGIALGAIAAVYLLRVAGDGSGTSSSISALSWLSPIGWAAAVRPFADERWWPLGLLLLLAMGSAGGALWLSSGRDLGAGLFRARLGPAQAGDLLSSPYGLAWRLQRASVLGWSAAVAMIAALYGGLADSVTQLIDDNPQIASILESFGGEQALTDTFFTAALGVVGFLVAASALNSALRLLDEERELRADFVLATATRRLHWAGGHLLIALVGPVVMLTVAGTISGLAYGLVVGDPVPVVGRLVRAALVHAPAIWAVVGVGVALYGLAPRLAGWAWGALIAFVLLGELGPALQLPQWLLNLSPFTHIPPIPEATPTPLIALTAIAATLTFVGLTTFSRRDLL